MSSETGSAKPSTLLDKGSRNYRLCLVLIFLEAIAAGLLLPVFPFLVEHFGGRPFLVTQLVALFSFFAFIGNPALGFASDRLGRGIVIALAFVGAAIVNLGILFLWSLSALFLMRAIDGVMSGRGSAITAAATDAIRGDHVNAIGWLTAARGTGLALAPIAGGSLSFFFESTDKYYTNLLLLAFALSVLGAVLSLSLAKTTGKGGAGPKRNFRADTLRLLRRHSLILGLVALLSIAFGVLLSTTALFVNRTFGWTEMETGWLLGLSAGTIVLARALIAGRVAKWMGRNRIILLMFLVGAVASWSMALLTHAASWVGAFTALSLSYGLVLVLLTASTSEAVDSHERGFALGIVQAVSAAAIVVSASLNGVLFEFVGWGAPYMLGGFSMLAGAVLMLQHQRAGASDRGPVDAEGSSGR